LEEGVSAPESVVGWEGGVEVIVPQAINIIDKINKHIIVFFIKISNRNYNFISKAKWFSNSLGRQLI
jgi:hypothetical protein